jgi:hypothetical protein
MRSIFIPVFCLVSIVTYAQNTPRRVGFRILGKDSINLALNEDYQMIEDSCATIIRHGHYDARNRIYKGKFTDVSKANPSLILSEGNYTNDGLKDGEFTSRFINGNLQSKGNYKNNKYDGKWAVNYENGKPRITFEVNDDIVKIVDVWNEKGNKIVDNGKGSYSISLGAIIWNGKLDGGRPDGTWKGYRTSDATQETVVKESFKKGVFQKGNNLLSEYTDASHISLFSQDMLPYVSVEKMMVSPVACGGIKQKHFVNAQYSLGNIAFGDKINELVQPILARVDIGMYNNMELVLDGNVNDIGIINNLRNNTAFNESIAQSLISQLRRLPAIQPATADGKAVKSNFKLTFVFSLGVYRYSWLFSQIPAK